MSLTSSLFFDDCEFFVGVFLNSKLKEYTIDFPATDIDFDCRLFETCITRLTHVYTFTIELT